MGRRCCVIGCSSTSRLPEHHGVTYHSVPLDPYIRAVWIRNTRLSTDRQITKSVLVCSRHFRRADFHPQRSGKYLLKPRVFPTVFPWGRVDAAQIEADIQQMKAAGNTGPSSSASPNESTEDVTKATVEATVAQIMAQTAELNAAAAIKEPTTILSDGDLAADSISLSSIQSNAKFEQVTVFNPGTRLEVQDFDGVWHVGRVVEVDNDDREVLIKFERTGKTKSSIVGTEEWIPMNSNRLRQKISTKPILVFDLEEKCMARWSGPRKFPGTVKKVLGNDTYEILFDDGYVKNVRAMHMTKMLAAESDTVAEDATVSTLETSAVANPTVAVATGAAMATPPRVKSLKSVTPNSTSGSGSSKKRAPPGPRKDWPLLDMSKLDLSALNLPEIPRDGEWTCHWVNDQPIGCEGFLYVGEHRKPTVIVEDWRLPPGWVKHMYQRSNVLGKWDVILVTPNGKRFRSKADLKVYLEDQGKVYNPDIYDFSIHRRRAKDINAYVYTSDYTPQHIVKPKSTLNTGLSASTSMDSPIAESPEAAVAAVLASSLATKSSSQFIETPVATAVPPMELMTPTTPTQKASTNEGANVSPSTPTGDAGPPIEDGYVYVGGLKIQIVDNLFRCPQESCNKNFRKENHLQIHIKHYHPDFAKLLGVCPKMQELAEKRTHTTVTDQNEPHPPKNQISNQEFFAKLHQQDLKQQQSRAQRRSHAVGAPPITTDSPAESFDPKSEPMEIESERASATNEDMSLNTIAANTSLMDQTLSPAKKSPFPTDKSSPGIPTKRSRFMTNKRTLGSRKSNRQRTTRRYLTAAQATSARLHPVVTADSSFGVSEFEETRHSFNATPDASKVLTDAKKRKSSGAPATSVSSLDSPATADSGSSSFHPLQAPSSNETVQPQYIKENGELIKIVRMRQEEIINCLCSYGEEDGLMIQCELCLCWQHGVCNGIDTESDVPDKYVCYICRNPQRCRESMRYKHDQDWLYEGKLPVAKYHIPNPNLGQRFDVLKKSHTITGNLIEMKQFMHSLHVKMNIASNRCHPKLYLWAKKWDEDAVAQQLKTDMKSPFDEMKPNWNKGGVVSGSPPFKKMKTECSTPMRMPNIPQPEAPIDPVECQHRLLEHIKVQQNLLMDRLSNIEHEIDALEEQEQLTDLRDADLGDTKDVLATFIKELDIMKQIAKLNALEHAKRAVKNQLAFK